MKRKLQDITSSQFGANTSGKPLGDIKCVQGRDFDAAGDFLGKDLQFVSESALRYTQPLRKGDVLFSAKGKFFATVWQAQVKEVIATSTFLIIKVTDPQVLPEYLALYLNSNKAKRYFDQNMKAATVPHIGKKDIEMLEIEIPPLQRQELLVRLNNLMKEEKNLAMEMQMRKEKILNYLI